MCDGGGVTKRMRGLGIDCNFIVVVDDGVNAVVCERHQAQKTDIKIRINTSYGTLDTAAMAAANEIYCVFKREERWIEYGITIFEKEGKYYLADIRKGKEAAAGASEVSVATDYKLAKNGYHLAGFVHSHPIYPYIKYADELSVYDYEISCFGPTKDVNTTFPIYLVWACQQVYDWSPNHDYEEDDIVTWSRKFWRAISTHERSGSKIPETKGSPWEMVKNWKSDEIYNAGEIVAHKKKGWRIRQASKNAMGCEPEETDVSWMLVRDWEAGLQYKEGEIIRVVVGDQEQFWKAKVEHLSKIWDPKTKWEMVGIREIVENIAEWKSGIQYKKGIIIKEKLDNSYQFLRALNTHMGYGEKPIVDEERWWSLLKEAKDWEIDGDYNQDDIVKYQNTYWIALNVHKSSNGNSPRPPSPWILYVNGGTLTKFTPPKNTSGEYDTAKIKKIESGITNVLNSKLYNKNCVYKIIGNNGGIIQKTPIVGLSKWEEKWSTLTVQNNRECLLAAASSCSNYSSIRNKCIG